MAYSAIAFHVVHQALLQSMPLAGGGPTVSGVSSQLRFQE